MTMINSLKVKHADNKTDSDKSQKWNIETPDQRDIETIREINEHSRINRLSRFIENSELGQRFQNRTFENFEVDKNNKDIYAKCLNYAECFKDRNNDGKGLLFIGTIGTGKTHLAAAISNYIIRNHVIPVKFGGVTSLLSEIKSTYGEHAKETENQVIKKLSDVDLLVIDDLGKEKATEWSNSIIYTIINNRYEDYKPIIITTNLTMHQLENTVGEATVSRLIEMCEGIKMDGDDYRKAKLMR